MSRRIYFILLSLGLYTHIHAQPASQGVFTITANNNPVRFNTICREKSGFILVGTDHGLYRFDGRQFNPVYFRNKTYTDTVTAIFQDHTSLIWVGFKSGRLAHVIKGQLEYYDPEEGTPAQRITGIAEDTYNRIWFSAYGEGIYCLEHKKLYLINEEDGLQDLSISHIYPTETGDMMLTTDQGIQLCRFTGGKKKVTQVTTAQGLPDYIATSISPAGVDRYWIGLQDNGFCLYDHRHGVVRHVDAAAGWRYGQVNDISDANGYAWIATADSGLFRYDRLRGTLSRQETVPGFNHLQALTTDMQGNTWLMSPLSGISKTTADLVSRLDLYPASFFPEMHVILADRQGRIWINDDRNHALLRYDLHGIETKPVSVPVAGLPAPTDITALYQDDHGLIWIGTMGKGLFILDPQTGKQRPVSENAGLRNILSLSGRANDLFVSSLEGAARISLAGPDIRSTFAFFPYDNSSTGSHYIYSIYRDAKGRTWFATDGNGIFMEDHGTYHFYEHRQDISNEHVYAITEDRAGNIWFSTAGNGIYRFDGKEFRNYGLTQGISDLNISTIKTDPDGNIVIIHKKGMDILNPVTNEIFYINPDATNTDKSELGSAAQDKDGNIYISSSRGIFYYKPIAAASRKPVTVMESVQLFLLDTDTSNHVYAHDENNFTFRYAGIYFTDPSQVHYRYKMEGLDTNWVMTSDVTQAFPKLEPGTYTFRVQSALNNSFTNATEARYSFRIRQAFYKTWWFITAMVLLLISLVYLYIRNRENGIRNMQRLENEKIRFQFDVLRTQVNPHFLFNNFNTLITAIEEDPKMAVEYVEQLSDFFRNIVNYRDKDIITVKEELGLLQTYFFLQQKRYGNNVRLDISLPAETEQHYFIPPLTLQLLAENAIKHNVVSSANPLQISITAGPGNTLLIANNKLARSSVQPGTGMGLENIISRYKLLTNAEVRIINNADNFIVSLPLIENPHA